MRRALAALIALATLAAPSAASAAEPIESFFNVRPDGTCPVYGDQEICTGQVPSFDGTPLDVDLTKPIGGEGDGKRRPLIVMLHGFGNNKHEWQSLTDEADGRDKYHWNSHWFAKHGYYVLTYTARGFRTDGRTGSYQPETPNGTSISQPNGKLFLKSRDFEIRDTQWLSALVAAGFNVDPEQIAVTGGSYGGGESWTQASQATWSFPNERDSSLPVLQLQVSVPKYPWTDLAYALAPNGHPGGPALNDIHQSSQGRPDDDNGEGNPVGNPKLSYLLGLFAVGQARGLYSDGLSTTPSEEEPKPNIPIWQARSVGTGDPYDVAGVEDPIIRQIRRGLTEFRSAYYQDEGWAAQESGRKVAIFSIQGWTDDLFHAVESFRMFKYLKALDPRWPVEVALADVGHSRGQNKPATWRRLNQQAFQFLQSHIRGSHEQETIVSSEPTLCPNDGEPDSNETASVRLTGRSPEDLANGTLNVAYARPGVTNNPLGADDPNGPATDPVLGGVFSPIIGPNAPCRTSPGPVPAGGQTYQSQPLSDHTTYIGLGQVQVQYALLGAQTATLHARVWDVPPGGQRPILMTRGTYRIDVPRYDSPAGTLVLPLFGNHWPLKPGHRIRLDLTQVDAGMFRPSNLTSTIQLGPPTLTLPTRESGDRALAGG